jgi:hypothetical protein
MDLGFVATRGDSEWPIHIVVLTAGRKMYVKAYLLHCEGADFDRPPIHTRGSSRLKIPQKEPPCGLYPVIALPKMCLGAYLDQPLSHSRQRLIVAGPGCVASA